jgi:hypothetical protein
MHERKSEIAHLREQIELACNAMNQMLSGYAVSSRHDIINHKYSVLSSYQEQLEPLVGEREAMEIIIETYNKIVR